jgi:Cation transporting ATPase, C-terminus
MSTLLRFAGFFYLLDSRYLLTSSFSLTAHMGKQYLPLGICGVVILQLLFTCAPPFQAMFGNETIPLWVWPWLLAGGLLFFAVVEAEKLVIRASDALRKTVTAVKSGAYLSRPTRCTVERHARHASACRLRSVSTRTIAASAVNVPLASAPRGALR